MTQTFMRVTSVGKFSLKKAAFIFFSKIGVSALASDKQKHKVVMYYYDIALSLILTNTAPYFPIVLLIS